MASSKDRAQVTTDQVAGANRAGRIIRSAVEIAYILSQLIAREEPIQAHLHISDGVFTSQLLVVDPIGSYIIIEPSANESANVALLSRPRCTFVASPPGRNVEFVAAEPKEIVHGGMRAIRLKFPEVLVEVERRECDRTKISRQIPLHCLADVGGVLSFNGGLADVSDNGIGFLVYDPTITLEPGTVLKGCRIEVAGMARLMLDLEVRYSQLVSLADGSRAKRSGCRVIAERETIRLLLEALSRHQDQS